jgi:hypothetical protein
MTPPTRVASHGDRDVGSERPRPAAICGEGHLPLAPEISTDRDCERGEPPIAPKMAAIPATIGLSEIARKRKRGRQPGPFAVSRGGYAASAVAFASLAIALGALALTAILRGFSASGTTRFRPT